MQSLPNFLVLYRVFINDNLLSKYISQVLKNPFPSQNNVSSDDFIVLTFAGYLEHLHLKGDRVVFIHAFDPPPMQSAKHSECLK